MQRIMLKSKIHRATITGADLHYEGSLAIDSALMDAADILAGEQVHVFNINTGARLITYAIPAPHGSGVMMLNGAAARLGAPGDEIIVAAFASVDDVEARSFKPRVLFVTPKNRIRRPVR